jgi:hypothetical protein
MNTKYTLTAILGAIALGVAAGPSAAQADSNAQPAAESPSSGQARIADTTLKLEKAFADQFVQGKIDRSALPIDEVIQAFPEAARPKVQAHVDQILTTGEKLASQMTPEQRTEAVTPPAAEKVGKTAEAQVAAWGWPGYAGWGGYGAFGFPGMYGYGAGWGLGLGYGGLGYGGLGYGGLGYGGLGYAGLGWGGLGWGGLGWGGLGWGGLGLGGWYW